MEEINHIDTLAKFINRLAIGEGDKIALRILINQHVKESIAVAAGLNTGETTAEMITLVRGRLL